jgi:signal transduction histidine kinase
LYVSLDAQLNRTVDQGLRARLDDLSAEAANQAGDPIADPFAQVLDRNGHVLAVSPTAPDSSVLTPAQRIAAQDRVVFVDGDVPGLDSPARLAAVAVPGTDRIVVTGTSLAGVRAATDRLLLILLISLPALLLALTALVRWTIRSSLRPVSALTSQATRISTAGTTDRLPQPPSGDEIAELASTLNAMLDRIQVSFERERAFVEDASHELRTPIAVLRGELELALLDGDAPQMRRAVEIAQAEAEHLSSLAVDLLVLARERAGALVLDPSRVEIRGTVESMVSRLRPVLEVPIVVDGDAVHADVDVSRLDQVVTNLVNNATQAGAGRVRVHVGKAGDDVVLDVDDDGPGFPEALMPTAFDRFTRGDLARTRRSPGSTSGTGLGLPIAAAIIRAHAGQISIGNDSSLGGARVRIRVPQVRRA